MSAQQAPTAAPLTSVPRLVRISNSFHPANGLPASPVEGVTLSIYREESGGTPLWQETQNVNVDAEGRYTVLMGSTLNDGMPLELFTSAEPRWLGVQFNRTGETEQPRVLVTSVPYALKAVDADTLGGLPASAYALSPTGAVSGAPTVANAATAAAGALAGAKTLKPRITSGTPNYFGIFTDTTDLGNSLMYQSPGGLIGVNTNGPFDYFHVRFSDTTGGVTGYAVQNMGSGAGSYSGMLFYDQNGNLGQFQGFNNSTHEYRINNIASGASINFMIGSSSKFLVASSGNIGISVTSPASKLDVGGDINLSGILRFGGTPVLQLPTTNLALGLSALASNTTGSTNTALGDQALTDNDTGTSNTAVGDSVLLHNTIGGGNTAIGYTALTANVNGGGNTAAGNGSLASNISGGFNTATGDTALGANTTGSGNIAIGFSAASAVSGGNSNNIHIGSTGSAGDSGTIRIGTSTTQTKFFAAGISGVTTGLSGAVSVVIDTNGQLGTISSSRRFKEDIQDMGEASSGLMRLRPVTFRYKKPFDDGSKPIQYGLIAEEVAEVYPDLVVHSADGQIQTVKYQVLYSMLLNEIQRQQTEIASQQREIGAQKDSILALEQQVREQQQRMARLESALTSLSNGPRVP